MIVKSGPRIGSTIVTHAHALSVHNLTGGSDRTSGTFFRITGRVEPFTRKTLLTSLDRRRWLEVVSWIGRTTVVAVRSGFPGLAFTIFVNKHFAIRSKHRAFNTWIKRIIRSSSNCFTSGRFPALGGKKGIVIGRILNERRPTFAVTSVGPCLAFTCNITIPDKMSSLVQVQCCASSRNRRTTLHPGSSLQNNVIAIICCVQIVLELTRTSESHG
mmetsp:Transcript_12875/g.18448  ORF Transcript_12875/g.18448 Transcript_12875/m.18448 type:complete len:215 (-) Transcript_12875:326-970(-)